MRTRKLAGNSVALLALVLLVNSAVADECDVWLSNGSLDLFIMRTCGQASALAEFGGCEDAESVYTSARIEVFNPRGRKIAESSNGYEGRYSEVGVEFPGLMTGTYLIVAHAHCVVGGWVGNDWCEGEFRAEKEISTWCEGGGFNPDHVIFKPGRTE